jgi:hypothetical protein
VIVDTRTTIPVRERPKTGETLTFAKAEDISFEDVPVTLDEYASMLIKFKGGQDACSPRASRQPEERAI